ncbi:MAG: hypothetical protein H0V91_14800 [Flavisolibacter sp.]|jgi:ribosome-associated toxin RatA of RatAB toxin-antitoxin module|nr:hypothetical protein [Flavisolibacter sp.]
MRLLRFIIISILLLFTLITLFGLLIPSTVRISKAIDIDAETNEIFSLIRDTAQWKHWHPAFQKTETHSALQEGLIINEVVATDSLVQMELSKQEKNKLLNGWQIHTHPNSEVKTLQWYMDFHLRWYPWERFGSLFYENTYGIMMEQGLQNINNLLSSK